MHLRLGTLIIKFMFRSNSNLGLGDAPTDPTFDLFFFSFGLSVEGGITNCYSNCALLLSGGFKCGKDSLCSSRVEPRRMWLTSNLSFFGLLNWSSLLIFNSRLPRCSLADALFLFCGYTLGRLSSIIASSRISYILSSLNFYNALILSYWWSTCNLSCCSTRM
jgi:hypothetical protein